jgi:hypothetical protein
MGLDGDASLPLQIHGVEELVLFFSMGNGPGRFEQSIRQSCLTVIDMGNDAEVARVKHSRVVGDYP